jgi:predicted DCC family thiol-disulfide oxidoreductase YuxK
MNQDKPIQILYDGHCPICCRQMAYFARRDTAQKLSYLDIRSDRFDPETIGKTTEELATRLYVRLPDGTLLSAMDAVRAAYRAIGKGSLISLTSWPLLRPLFDHLYRWVAANRLSISRWLHLSKNEVKPQEPTQ